MLRGSTVKSRCRMPLVRSKTGRFFCKGKFCVLFNIVSHLLDRAIYTLVALNLLFAHFLKVIVCYDSACTPQCMIYINTFPYKGPVISTGLFICCIQNQHSEIVKLRRQIYVEENSGLTLGLRPANERRGYNITPSLIGWVQTWNQPWNCIKYIDLSSVQQNMMTSSNGNVFRSPVNSPHKGQRRGTLMFSLICARINCRVNDREAGDLRRHRAHYDVIVMNMLLFGVLGFLIVYSIMWYV